MNKHTRVWWDGTPVQFIRWTEKGLVFNWDDPNETAIHMPRGTVMRLMEKGVLEIEGYMPVWVCRQETHQKSAKLNLIARLIKKLSGGDPARVTH